MHLNLPKSYTRQFTLLVLYFVTGMSDLNEESNSKYPVFPNGDSYTISLNCWPARLLEPGKRGGGGGWWGGGR